jgi:polysaccharide export outer membrane protein
MTYETVASANLTPYVPPQLPAPYQPDAVAVSAAAVEIAPNRTGTSPGPLETAAYPSRIVYGAPPSESRSPYRIGVGEVLLLAVKGLGSPAGLPDLITAQAKRDGYIVQDDGAIAIPDAGRVEVAGLTLEEARFRISEALFAANIEPSFSLEVAEFNSQHVSVDGLVGSPGLVPITLDPPYLYTVIARAGGVPSDDPATTTIQILRDGVAYRFSLVRFIHDPVVRRAILRNGDSIYVASAETIEQEGPEAAPERARQQLEREQALFERRLSLGAVKRSYVFTTGEVRKSGQAVLPFEQSLYLANVLFGDPGGGINIETGDFGAIYVLRASSDPRQAGGMTAYHLDAENVANLALAAQFEMRPNDIVFVAEQPVTSWNRVLRQIYPLISAPQRVVAAAP